MPISSAEALIVERLVHSILSPRAVRRLELGEPHCRDPRMAVIVRIAHCVGMHKARQHPRCRSRRPR